MAGRGTLPGRKMPMAQAAPSPMMGQAPDEAMYGQPMMRPMIGTPDEAMHMAPPMPAPAGELPPTLVTAARPRAMRRPSIGRFRPEAITADQLNDMSLAMAQGRDATGPADIRERLARALAGGNAPAV